MVLPAHETQAGDSSRKKDDLASCADCLRDRFAEDDLHKHTDTCSDGEYRVPIEHSHYNLPYYKAS